ncbi:hypothetical protein BOX15_Mlig029771g2, partial [Macrostomum lignano]
SKRKQAKRFAAVKRMISLNDGRIRKRDRDKPAGKKRKPAETNSDPLPVRHKTAVSSAMFLHYNTQIGPPYHILLDTNYVNFAIKNRLDVFQSAMDCLYGKCVLYVTDCVLAEMEKMGEKYRVALKILHDPRCTGCPACTRALTLTTVWFAASPITNSTLWPPAIATCAGDSAGCPACPSCTCTPGGSRSSGCRTRWALRVELLD